MIGEGQKMPAAIVQPNFDFVKNWAKIHNVDIGESLEDLANNTAVQNRIWEEVENGNKHFGKWETIKRIELTPETWSIELDLLTPTFKPKRETILKRYKHLYDKIYN